LTSFAADQKPKAKPYPLNTCTVSDEKLGEDVYIFVQDGQEVKLCCKDCLKDFKKSQDKYMKKIKEANAKVKAYTLTTCAVSGEKLGDMGDAYTFVYDGQEMKLCCKDCLKDFNKSPAKYMAKIKEAKK
jgi:YHS domain-containing protein